MNPYPSPEAVRTDKRCAFKLAGSKYDCRAMGKYVLEGLGYCASHYDLAWRIANPKFGQQHEWGPNKFLNCDACVKCGTIRSLEGLPFTPCRGHLPRIVLRHARGVVREWPLWD